MREPALLLTEDNPSRQDHCIAKLLQFFGISSRGLTAAEFPAVDPGGDANSDKTRVLCSAEVFLQWIKNLERSEGDTPMRFHSIFVYAGRDREALQKVARMLAADDGAVVAELNHGIGELVVSDHLKEFCGVLAGVRVPVSQTSIATSLVVHTCKGNTTDIISVDHGATFQKVNYRQLPVFLSTCREIVDIDTELTSRSFDVRDQFLCAAPIVLYVKWAFPETCWNAPEANACLVIDDPLLKPSYGCVNFAKLLGLMERHRFSTNIAFIPWNCRRSNRDVIRLFNQKPEYYSLSIHGCDHTAAEFGSYDREYLRWKVTEAIDRMSDHERQTGIHHDRIMVFPQGIFSEAAMEVLKHSNFTAAVNSEVISADRRPQRISVADVWDIAVMRYGAFPMFTRRDPSEGIENFAFDILLGKPCIIVVHHDFCRDRYKHLLEFIDRLNRLNHPLSWRSLGEVVRRSCRQRELAPGVLEIEMYGAELQLEDRSARGQQCFIRRREFDPSAIKEIWAESVPMVWNFANDYINLETELGSGESKTVRIRFHEPTGRGRNGENVSYKFKAMLRRYLSELRDNYIVRGNVHLSVMLG